MKNRKDAAKDPEAQQLLYIDYPILSERKTRWKKKLAMAWIDYKKANDMVPQSWVINCLKMYKISHEVINFTEKTQKTRPQEEKAWLKQRSKEVFSKEMRYYPYYS